jgi:hypothetical protein
MLEHACLVFGEAMLLSRKRPMAGDLDKVQIIRKEEVVSGLLQGLSSPHFPRGN